ncbi:MAG: hypothetical protein QOD75_1009 [Blastocatellia bacterium]|nr:hypothetical protein [Blastocatellia bacterium]
MMAGYSGTPLIKKLGIKENFRIALVGAPPDFVNLLDPLPETVSINARTRQPLDFVLLFAEQEGKLRRNFSRYAAKLQPAGMIWVAWPKKSSGVATDLAFNNVQALGLAAGLVDVKICAVDEVWSGLKFVFRLKDRHGQNRLP